NDSGWNSRNGFASSTWSCTPRKRACWNSGRTRQRIASELRLGKPETFNFLGFTHICGKKRSNGRFTVVRQTIRQRLQAKLREVKPELRRRLHRPIRDQGA